jgi:glycerophosphoryl diester phosphodiesterase
MSVLLIEYLPILIFLGIAIGLGLVILLASFIIARQRHISAAAASGVPILVYTVNDPARARKLLDAGVTKVFTDNVQAVAAAVEQRPAAA